MPTLMTSVKSKMWDNPTREKKCLWKIAAQKIFVDLCAKCAHTFQIEAIYLIAFAQKK